MEQEYFIFIFKGKEYPVPHNFLRLGEINSEIYRKLIKDKKYEIKSEVNEEIFNVFIKYLTGTQVPEINEINKSDFLQLSKEFNVMRNLIISVEDERIECLNDIQSLQDPNVLDNSIIENKISHDFDNYLELCGEKLLESPINSLNNIFIKVDTKFKNQNLAYYLIKNHYEKHKNLNIFILLHYIDGSRLNQENLKDAIDSRHWRMNYMPQIEFSFILNLLEEQQKLSTENNNLQLENQIQTQKIENLKKILFSFISKTFNEYDSNELKNNIIIPIVEKEKWKEDSLTKCSLAINNQLITVTSSSTHPDKYHSVVYLFNGKKEDDENGNRWASNYINSAEIIINFQKPVLANVLLMTPRYLECINQAPNNFNVYAGNNLENLNLVKEFKNIKWNNTDKRRFLFDNINEYTYYKIEFTGKDNQHFGLSELNLGELIL